MPYMVGNQLVECQHNGCQSRTSSCHPVCPIHATCWYNNTFVLSLCQICTSLLVTTLDVNAHNIQRIQAVNNLFKWIAIISTYVRHRKLPFNITMELRCLTRRSYSNISSEEWGNLLQLFIMNGTMSQFLPDGRSRYMASFPSCGLHDLTNIFQMRRPEDIHLSWNSKWEVPRSFRFRLGYPIQIDSPRIPPQYRQTQSQSTEADLNQNLPSIWLSGDNIPLVNYEDNLPEVKSQASKSVVRGSSETKAYSSTYRFDPPTNQDPGGLKQDIPESDYANAKRQKLESQVIDTSQGPSSSVGDPYIHYDAWRPLPPGVIVLLNDSDKIVGFKYEDSGKVHIKDVDVKNVDNKLFFKYKAVEMSVTAKVARTVASCRTALSNLTSIFPNFGMAKDIETRSKYPASKFVYHALEVGHFNSKMWTKDRYLAWLGSGKLDVIEMPVFIITLQNEGLSGLKQCLLEPILNSDIANKQLKIDGKLLNRNLLIADYETRNNLWDILSMLSINEYVLSCMGELQCLHMSEKANTATQAITEVIHASMFQLAYIVRQAMIKFFSSRKALRDEAIKDRNLSDSNISRLVESSPFCKFLFPETIVEELTTQFTSHVGPSGIVFERQVEAEPIDNSALQANLNTPSGNRGRGYAKGKGKGKKRGNIQK